MRGLLAVDAQRALEHDQRQRAALGDLESGAAPLLQAHVPHIHRGEGARRSGVTAVASRDHPHASGVLRQWYRRNVGIEQGLVTGRGHLGVGRQVHPQLHHVESATRAGEFRRVVFLVEDAGGGGHPLHVARADAATGAGGIAVLQFAFVHDGHRLEPAVRMLADTARMLRRLEPVRTGVVEQQERAQVAAVGLVREQRPGRKTIAHPVRTRGAVDAENLLHGGLPPGRAGHDLRWRPR